MGGPAVVLLILLGLAFITVLFREQANAAFQISYDQFIHEVEANNVTNVEITGSTVREHSKVPHRKTALKHPRKPDCSQSKSLNIS